jgi:hypothetical protein
VPKQSPRRPYRATLRSGAGDQVTTEKPCEVERMTKSLLSNLARQSGQPSLYQATLRGGANNQVPVEQPYQRLAQEKVDPMIRAPCQRDKPSHHQTTSGLGYDVERSLMDVRRHLTTYCLRLTTTDELGQSISVEGISAIESLQ